MSLTIHMGLPGTDTPAEVAWIVTRLGACSRIAASGAASQIQAQAECATAIAMGFDMAEDGDWFMMGELRDWMRRRQC